MLEVSSCVRYRVFSVSGGGDDGVVSVTGCGSGTSWTQLFGLEKKVWDVN